MDTSTTLLHAITFLLSPLTRQYPPQVIDALHLNLLSSFSRLDLSQIHSFLISTTAPPPEPIKLALNALSNSFPQELRVHWQDWALLLGNGNQLILALMAGQVQVTVRDIQTGQVSARTVWNAALQARSPSPWGTSPAHAYAPPPQLALSSSESSADSDSSRASSPVVAVDSNDMVAVEAAENVLNEDDEIVFTNRRSIYGGGQPSPMFMPPVVQQQPKLNATAPEWYPGMRQGMHAKTPSMGSYSPSGPSLFQGAAAAAKMAPVGTRRSPFQMHSRSSSRSSTVSNCTAPSLISSYSSGSSSYRQPPPLSSSVLPPSPTPSDEGDATFYVDPTKDQKAVTEYECGKVGVLTGAVMLGPSKGTKSVRVSNPRRV